MMNNRDCDISFVIVSWNACKFLRDCLLSLQNSVHNLNTEVIVVDNASTDDSVDMVREQFPQVSLICNDRNVGFACANNQGIEISRGNYLFLVNSDVEVFPDSIQKLYDFMEEHQGAGIVGPRVLNTDLSLQHSCRTLPTNLDAFFRAFKLDTTFPDSRLFGRHQMLYWDYSATREVGILSGCFWSIRRAALEQVGLLDIRFFIYGEDKDFCKRFKEKGWKVIFFAGAQIIHHGGASSANAPARFWIEMQRANLQFQLKHYDRFSTVLHYAALVLHNLVRIIFFSLQDRSGRQRDAAATQKLVSSRSGLSWLLSRETLSAVWRGNL